MCLGIPAKVIEINGEEGVVDIRGVKRRVNLSLVKDVKVNDWVIIHVGFAISKITEEEVKETNRLLDELLALER